MMFFARIVAGSKPEVYPLSGALFLEPKSWLFESYRRGACAFGYTKADALFRAKRRLEMPRPALAPALRVRAQSNHVLRLPA